MNEHAARQSGFHPFVYLACIAGLLCGCRARDNAAAEADFKSPYYALGLSPTNPAIACLSVDGLGQGRLGQNPVFVESQPAPAVAGSEAWRQTTRLPPRGR